MESKLYFSDVVSVLKSAGLFVRGEEVSTDNGKLCVKINHKDIKDGSIFIAYKGVSFDSHQLIEEAIEKGAKYIILESEDYISKCDDVSYALVKNSREAWTHLVAREWGDPQNDLYVVGLTGTNGKTSTVWIYKELLKMNGIPCLSIGTLGAYVGDKFHPTSHTTPDPHELFRLLNEAKSSGIKHVIMEVSSHSLIQKKIGPIRFDCVGFTSFSQDHLDFHSSMEEYLDAKWLLFTDYLRSKDTPCVISYELVDLLQDRLKSLNLSLYGDESETTQYKTVKEWLERANCFTTINCKKIGTKGSEIKLVKSAEERDGVVPLFGQFALKNFTAALSLVEHTLGKSIETSLWKDINPVPGRLELVTTKEDQPLLFVDYAHTPDALEKALKALRPFCQSRLIAVFGCGGDRDRSKRPQMAMKVEEAADVVIVTSDNPRTEDPFIIIKDVMTGFKNPGKVIQIENREKAISYAVENANSNDTILVAGKGHEDYQIIGKTKHHFDDREVASKYLQKI